MDKLPLALPSTAQKFAHPNCQHLVLEHTHVTALTNCYLSPYLEDLQIRTSIAERSQGREVQTPFDTDTLIHYMEQSSMKRLVLWDMRVTDEIKSTSQYPEIEDLNRLGRLSTLELRQINVTYDTLVKILRTCNDLRSFTLTRPTGNRGGIGLHELAMALQPVSQTLTALMLSYNSVHKAPEATVLHPLCHMRSLLNLTIDPSFYLGRRLCPYYPFAPPTLAHHRMMVTRTPSSFADLLPDNLINLILHIDIEQMMRLPGYRRDIIQSIIAARARLQYLREITLVEDERSWTDVNVCSCRHCYSETVDAWRREADEVLERKEMVKALRKVDIGLFRDEADGTGRYECTVWGNA